MLLLLAGVGPTHERGLRFVSCMPCIPFPPSIPQLLDEYFGGAKPDGEDGGEQGDELGSDGDAFLRDFIAKKAWVEHDDHVPTYREVRLQGGG